MTYMYVYQYHVIISFEGHCMILVSILADFSQVKHTHSDTTHTELEMQSLTIIIAVGIVQNKPGNYPSSVSFTCWSLARLPCSTVLLRPHILSLLGL